LSVPDIKRLLSIGFTPAHIVIVENPDITNGLNKGDMLNAGLS
jgi:hypothetical protein